MYLAVSGWWVLEEVLDDEQDYREVVEIEEEGFGAVDCAETALEAEGHLVLVGLKDSKYTNYERKRGRKVVQQFPLLRVQPELKPLRIRQRLAFLVILILHN